MNVRAPIADNLAKSRRATVAYYDSVVAYLPWVTNAERRKLEGFGYLTDLRRPGRPTFGFLLTVQQPSQFQLHRLDEIVRSNRGSLVRFDLALDVQTANKAEADDLQRQIAQQAILRWRRKGPMLDYDGTLYWVDFRGKRRPPRNLALYTDKANRLTGEAEGCVHLEIRVCRARTIRRQGIVSVSDLIRINPRALMEKNVKWSDAGHKNVLRSVRATVKADRLSHAKMRIMVSNRYDSYRKTIPQQVEALFERMRWDTAQYVKDNFPRRTITTVPSPVVIPTRLTWPDQWSKARTIL